MNSSNRAVLLVSLIAVVNALGYGIIIPILYSYSQKFGLSDFDNGLLFSIYSVCQFISTPIIGRLSDKIGRKPLLVVSIAGTALSFFMMAWAPSALFLFIARALDGITAGNLPVASAVISDSTEAKDRARGFGIIGASFGFGFVFGPAISALTVGFGASIPFIIAGVVTLAAVFFTALFLPETNVHKKEVAKAPFIDLRMLLGSLTDPQIGSTLMITLIYSLAISMFIYAYQPFSVKVLGLSSTQISVNFTVYGLVSLIAQAILIPRLAKRFGEESTLLFSLILSVVTFSLLFFSTNYLLFFIVSIFHGLSNAFVNPLVQSLLSKEVDNASQGSIMGVNASYMSIGFIFGPIIGGVIAGIAIPTPFLVGGFLSIICALYAASLLKRPLVVRSEFSKESA